MSLQNLLAIGRLQEHTPDAEATRLLAHAEQWLDLNHHDLMRGN